MRAFNWPGNVRELLNRVQRAAVVAEGTLIGAADLDLLDAQLPSPFLPASAWRRVSAEREAVLNCLRESRYNISECARRLNVSRVTVYRLCKKHRLELGGLRGNGFPFRADRPAGGVNGHRSPATRNV